MTNGRGSGNTRLAVIGFGVAVIGLALALVITMQALALEQQRAARYAAVADSLRAAAQARLDSTAASFGAGGIDGLRSGFGAAELARLQRQGLADPIDDLRGDLRKHPELIPFSAEHGGTMGFHDPGGIRILDDRWVLAEFEDGHVGGTVLLEYQVTDGRIRWTRLAAKKY